MFIVQVHTQQFERMKVVAFVGLKKVMSKDGRDNMSAQMVMSG